MMDLLRMTREDFLAKTEAFALGYLHAAARAAKRAGVQCDLVHERNAHPYRAIIATARSRACDLICMSSHGRGGLQAQLLGSQTQKVLTHSKTPVLVLR